MKRFLNIFLLVILIIFTFCSCGLYDDGMNLFEDKDNKLADACIDNLYNAIKDGDKEAVKDLFSNKAYSDANNIEASIDELLQFINGELLSWDREESPIVEDCVESGKTTKHEMFWFSLKTSEENYSIFLSYYPVEEINPNNKGIYSMLIIKKCDEDTLEGSTNEWSAIPGIKICNTNSDRD